VIEESAGFSQSGVLGIERRTHGDIKTIDVDKAWIWVRGCGLLSELQVRNGVLILMGWSFAQGSKCKRRPFPKIWATNGVLL